MGRGNPINVSHISAAMLAFGIAGSVATYPHSAMAQDASPSAPDSVTVVEPEAGQVEGPVIHAEDGTPMIIASPEQAVETQTARTVYLDPIAPIPLIAGLAALYAAIGVYPFRRRINGAFLRAAAGATLTVLMLNPEMSQEQRQSLPTEVLVVIDQSSSQRFGDRAAETIAAYEDVIRQLSGLENVVVRTVEVSNENEDGTLQDGTYLFNAVRGALGDIPRDQLGAVIMITDGLVDDVPQQFEALGQDVPLHTLVTGADDEFDRRIEIVNAPRFGLIDGEQTLQVIVNDDGAFPISQVATVTVSANGEVIQEYQATSGETLDITVSIEGEGANIFEVSVEGVDGELTHVNNTISTEIEGIREDLNVLLLSGEPGASGRQLRDILRADPGTNLVHFTTLRPPYKPQNVPLGEVALIPMPTNEILSERIEDFDLIIFDRQRLNGLLNFQHFSNIRRYVEGGGALLIINGDEILSRDESIANSSTIRALMPATFEDTYRRDEQMTPELTEEGDRHPVTRGLERDADGDGIPDWGRWLTSVNVTPAEGSDVLLSNEDGEPLLILNRVGEGRVAMLMSDNFWLWARGYDGGGPAGELLQRISHWLMSYPELEEEDLNLTLSDDGRQLIVTRQSLDDDVSEPVILTSPSGQEIEVSLDATGDGLYRGVVDIDELGFYSATHTHDADLETGEDATLSSFVSVGPPNPQEFIQTISTLARMQPFYDEHLGVLMRIGSGDGRTDAEGTDVTQAPQVSVPEIDLLPASATQEEFNNMATLSVRQSESFVLQNVENKPLIHPMLGMLAALGFFAGAWYREGGGRSLSLRRKAETTEGTPKVTAPKLT